MTHLPYAPWCDVCVKARAVDDAHRRVTLHRHLGEMGVPKVAFDYGFFRARAGAPKTPFLAGVSSETGLRCAIFVSERTGTDTLAVDGIEQALRNMGHLGPVILRSDGESALQSLLATVASRREARTFVEQTPREDSKANGLVERSVRAIEEMARVGKLDLNRERMLASPQVPICSSG